MQRNELFESCSVPKAIAKLSIPTIIGMIVMIVYNMADTFFVGMTNDVNQVASVTVTMPIFMFLMSLGTIFGVGGASPGSGFQRPVWRGRSRYLLRRKTQHHGEG